MTIAEIQRRVRERAPHVLDGHGVIAGNGAQFLHLWGSEILPDKSHARYAMFLEDDGLALMLKDRVTGTVKGQDIDTPENLDKAIEQALEWVEK